MRKMGFDYFLQVFYGLVGASAVAIFVYNVIQVILPDRGLLEAQQRLGVEFANRQYRHWILEYLSPFYRLMVPRVQQIKMPKYRKEMKVKFVAAGVSDQFDADEFFALKIASSVVAFVLLIFAAVNFDFSLSLSTVFLVIIGGFFLPDLSILELKSKRHKKIQKELPTFMDLMTLSVEAGLDFMAAISRVVQFAKPGPLRDEFNQMLKELQLGTVRADALRNLADRVQLPELSSFATILIQADQMGASIGPVLRTQSDLLRQLRFQKAEREGAKAAQKILMPLIFFIFPAVFIAIMAPIIIQNIYEGGFLAELLGGGP